MRDFVATLENRIRWKLGQKDLKRTIAPFEIRPEEVDAYKSENPGPIEQAYYAHEGRIAHKWVHYLPIYDRIFRDFRGEDVRMLEIGVQKGGSLELWRHHFGEKATIYGIDINPECLKRADPPNKVMIGSQDDPDFLRRVVNEMGPPNIILDDGSHIGRDQIASFKSLFPLMQPGGLYVIEDLQTSYWAGIHEGGYRRRGTAVEFVKSLIDDLNSWYHDRPFWELARDEIYSIQFFSAVVVIEKGRNKRSGHVKVGHAEGQEHRANRT